MVTACRSKYDRRVTIKRLQGTADAAGHVDNTADSNWTTYVTAWASVQTRGGREFWKVQQVTADVSHVWLCPWGKLLAEASPDMRLEYEDNVYHILSVINIDEQDKEIEIQTRRAV